MTLLELIDLECALVTKQKIAIRNKYKFIEEFENRMKDITDEQERSNFKFLYEQTMNKYDAELCDIETDLKDTRNLIRDYLKDTIKIYTEATDCYEM